MEAFLIILQLVNVIIIVAGLTAAAAGYNHLAGQRRRCRRAFDLVESEPGNPKAAEKYNVLAASYNSNLRKFPFSVLTRLFKLEPFALL